MKQKVSTENADLHIRQIFDHIDEGSPQSATNYANAAYDAFFSLPDRLTPKRASENLPEYVREISVKGFKGYTLRIAYIGEKVGLVAAFRPGLTHNMKNTRTRMGMKQFRQK